MKLRSAFAAVVAMAVLIPLGVNGLASARTSATAGPRPTIVLLHGDWADASSWDAVTERLQRKHYAVVAAPNPLRGPTADAAYVASLLQTIRGPLVLVAHSYGGFVATNAATGNPNVKALVYVDAFIPDEGQRLADLAAGSCVDPAHSLDAVPGPGNLVDVYLRAQPDGPYKGFSRCFANGVDREQAAVLQAAQRPATLNQYAEPSGVPAWRTIPAWALIGTADHVIPAAQQQAMAAHAGAHVTKVDAGHLSLITRPDKVTKVIEAAVSATR
jgi:pimeloyl-ACP methyl ester carboxylesterase